LPIRTGLDTIGPVHAPTPRLTICLTFDFDAVSLWTQSFRSDSPSDVSRGEFGPRTAVPRILALLDRRGLEATFFVPAVTARQFPESVSAIAGAGHEVACHGDRHEHIADKPREREEVILRRSIETLTEVCGRTPVGYRAPGWAISVNTIALLSDAGIAYDSSQCATDFEPYLARRDDRIEDREWTPGIESDVWEIPIAWELDDFPHFILRPPQYTVGRAVNEVYDTWAAEFDYAYANVPDGVYTLTMHPQLIGRGPRLEMLERLIDHMQVHDGIAFSRVDTTVGLLNRKRDMATTTRSETA
jgi:peptidoglycan/xylan/chitin deacetylase (PgdA/CDA1 family)